MKKIPRELLTLLADGGFHSGDELGQALGMSRAAVWKQLQKLEEMQLDLQSVKGRGYRLCHPLDFLASEEIARAATLKSSNTVQVHDELDSSNAELLRCLQQGGLCSGHCVLTEMQHSGRGRRGRKWLSPYGKNIYLSMLWRFEQGMSALDGLSLVVGLAVLESVYEMTGVTMQLKWPNDLLYQGRKMAGILLEVVGDPNGLCDVVIGVGVNVNFARGSAGGDIDQPWTSLLEVAGEAINRNTLAGVIIKKLYRHLAEFDRRGFAAFAARWSDHDAYKGCEVLLSMGDRLVSGVACGVNEKGELLLETDQGQHAFNAGEVSLRLAL